MNTAETHDIHVAEELFKHRLLELGLLTSVTPRHAVSTLPRDRQPAPVSGIPTQEIYTL